MRCPVTGSFATILFVMDRDGQPVQVDLLGYNFFHRGCLRRDHHRCHWMGLGLGESSAHLPYRNAHCFGKHGTVSTDPRYNRNLVILRQMFPYGLVK